VLQQVGLRAIELELMITGLPTVDVEDWRKFTQTHITCKHADGDGESESVEVITWFWDIVKEMDAGERAKVLSFTCGSGRLAPGGFAAMKPPFIITIMEGKSDDHLPTSHTCMNQLCLPEYSSREKLKAMLTKAVNLDAGFGFL